MGSKTDTYGNPPASTLDAPPLIPPHANCWRPQRRADGVEELVECSLAELKGNLYGGEIASTAWLVTDWELWK